MSGPTLRTHHIVHSGATAALLASGLLLCACALNPVTGRPEAVLTTEAGEIQQGNETAEQIKEQIGLVEAPILQAYVREIGRRLARHSQRQNLEYHFHAVEMAQPNAFALPGGHVYVSRGLLALANSEDELAAVIGHELGHVAARHSVARQAASAPLIPIKIAAGLGGAAVGIVSPSLGKVVAGAAQLPGDLALASYSRNQEMEADRLGQEYAAAAGWKPEALSSFLHTLAREEKLAGNEADRASFFSSHPTSPERSAQTRKYAKELTPAATDPVASSHQEFLHRLEGLVVGERAAEGVFVENRFLQPDMDFAITFPEGWKTVNSRSAVGAQSSDEKGAVVLKLAGEGDDPMQAANAFASSYGLKGQLRSLEVGGLTAVEGETEVVRGSARSAVYLMWIASNGLVYQIAGACPSADYERLGGAFRATATSFHPLRRDERKQIFEKRLRVTIARQGETLDALLQRSQNAWEPKRAAVANSMELGTTLEAGALAKIAVLEPYTKAAADD
jgi:predicted Zn-dependent protease